MGKILIVEDDNIISEGLKSIIYSIDNSLEVLTTGFASKALEYSKKYHIDAFFLDIQLEDYSGLELAKEIRGIEKYKFIPIVFITAIPTRELEAFRTIHCYDYIIKPFTKEEVEKVFNDIIKYGINEKREEKTIKIRQENYTYVIGQADIIYIEAKNRKLYIKTAKENFVTSSYTLKMIINELSDDFIRCHKGFIINNKFIKKVDKSNNYVYLKRLKGPVPIGRKFKENLCEDLI
ncbi:response regulator transcription factor [Clostridium sp. D2Q-14]|uniref:LytR/AlgR family response regulator transcription factor n=1 Tax=Anaeromonas gelatinilytica TaxID=2683194 RepID=UPI00193BE96A|nr:LytTR family DNA-binding domain-containing protein [Anaeromonas gelatinilytica]MBS4535133.1 response regulator transcription factor [Anaeromonas gelatinilytica]